MQVFYAPNITGDTHTLDDKESKHLIRVLRMKEGTSVSLIDGKGNLYEGKIADPDPKNCLIQITSVIEGFEKRNYRLHIAISLLKNPERFEWFVEKSVEIGIDEITPLICRNTEKKGLGRLPFWNLSDGLGWMVRKLRMCGLIWTSICPLGSRRYIPTTAG